MGSETTITSTRPIIQASAAPLVSDSGGCFLIDVWLIVDFFCRNEAVWGKNKGITG